MHRPKYDDWTFPKGKQSRGALRSARCGRSRRRPVCAARSAASCRHHVRGPPRPPQDRSLLGDAGRWAAVRAEQRGDDRVALPGTGGVRLTYPRSRRAQSFADRRPGGGCPSSAPNFLRVHRPFTRSPDRHRAPYRSRRPIPSRPRRAREEPQEPTHLLSPSWPCCRCSQRRGSSKTHEHHDDVPQPAPRRPRPPPRPRSPS